MLIYCFESAHVARILQDADGNIIENRAFETMYEGE